MQKALLATLLLASAATAQIATPPPPAFNTIGASDGYRNALTQVAQRYEQSLSTHCAKVELQPQQMQAKVYGPFQLDDKGNVLRATWKESTPGTACQQTRLYNAMVLIREGKPQVLPLFPGHSYSGPQLQHDAMTESVAEAAIAGAGKNCPYDAIDTALPNGEPTPAHPGWEERWTLRPAISGIS